MNYESKVQLDTGDNKMSSLDFCFACWTRCDGSCAGSCSGGCSTFCGSCVTSCSGTCTGNSQSAGGSW